MQRVSFNDGWTSRVKTSMFLEFVGKTNPRIPVRLPHDSMIGGQRDPSFGWGTGYFPSGTSEYRKTFVVPEDDGGKRIFVEFEGVYRDARVQVNGSFAAHHPYGYTGFTVPIDHLVRPGEENEIVVDATAHEDARWYSGAGISTVVNLVVGELVHLGLDSLCVRTPEIDDTLAVLEVTATLENDGAATTPTMVTTEIVDDNGAVVTREVCPVTAFPRSAERVSQRLYVPDARRWSVDTPTLYTCRVVVRDADGTELDRDSTHFGIRSLQLDTVNGLRINGEIVNLRGACIHHDNGVIGAATIARADERRVELLKAAGFNAIRSAHNPASKALLDACDRIGMLVMDEAFDMWTEPKMHNDYARAFPDWWREDLAAMVRKDRNHPSVVLYSIGNEIPDTGNPTGAARRACHGRAHPLARRHALRHQRDQRHPRGGHGRLPHRRRGGRVGRRRVRRVVGREHVHAADGRDPAAADAGRSRRRGARRAIRVPRRRRVQLRRRALGPDHSDSRTA